MMHKSLYSHLPVVDENQHSVGVVDIVKLSMHLHDLISKVKRQCTVQSLFSMWEESQSSTVVGDGGWIGSPGGLDGLGIDDIQQIPMHKFAGEASPPQYRDDDMPYGNEQFYGNESGNTFQPWDTASHGNGSVLSGVTGLTTQSAKNGMFKIFDGVDIQRFHFNPSNPDFDEFRSRICKKLGIDSLMPDLLSIYYLIKDDDDGGWQEIKMTDGNSLQEALNLGLQLNKDIELVAVLNAGRDCERVFTRPGRPRSKSSKAANANMMAGVVPMDTPMQMALAVAGGAVVLASLGWIMTKLSGR